MENRCVTRELRAKKLTVGMKPECFLACPMDLSTFWKEVWLGYDDVSGWTAVASTVGMDP